MENKNGLYMIAIVSIVAIVGILIMTISSSGKNVVYSESSDASELSGESSSGDSAGLAVSVTNGIEYCYDKDGLQGSIFNGVTHLSEADFYVQDTGGSYSRLVTNPKDSPGLTLDKGIVLSEFYCNQNGVGGYYNYVCPAGLAKGLDGKDIGKCAGTRGATYTCTDNELSNDVYTLGTVTFRDSSGSIVNIENDACLPSRNAQISASAIQVDCSNGKISFTISPCPLIDGYAGRCDDYGLCIRGSSSSSSCSGSSSQSCTVGVGACAKTGTQTRTCSNGVWSSWSSCSAQAGMPVAEICGNSIDDDCDGSVDEVSTWYKDNDRDSVGSTSSGTTTSSCKPDGYSGSNGDCNDNDAAVFMTVTCYADLDGDSCAQSQNWKNLCAGQPNYVVYNSGSKYICSYRNRFDSNDYNPSVC